MIIQLFTLMVNGLNINLIASPKKGRLFIICNVILNMKYSFSIILFLIASVIAASQTINNDSFSFTVKQGLTFVDTIEVNSKLSLKRFIIDTGSEFTILDSEFVKNLSFIKTDKIYNVHDIMGYERKQNAIKIDSLKLGSYIYYNILALVIDLSIYDIDGLIGCNIMKKFVWEFDYPNQKITRFFNILEITSKPDYIIPFKLKKGTPHINIRDVAFDIGNRNAISFALKDTSFLLTKSAENYYIKTYFHSINNQQRQLLKVNGSIFKDVSFGSFILESATAIFIGKIRSIGLPLLYDSKVIIDFPSGKIYFNKFEHKSYATIGCRFELNSFGDILVSSITEGSPADKAGIRLDDVLIYVEGYKDLESLKESVSDNTIYNYLGKTVTLKMEGWEKEKTIDVYLK
jgi:hypothetical protein